MAQKNKFVNSLKTLFTVAHHITVHTYDDKVLFFVF